jgi:hypothetical protein
MRALRGLLLKIKNIQGLSYIMEKEGAGRDCCSVKTLKI